MPPSGSPLALQELIDYCIDFLFASAADLKACALVSRSWTQTAQMHLFNHIVLGSPGYTYGETRLLALTRARCGRLFEAFASSPRLVGSIESLQIYLDTVPIDVLTTISQLPFIHLRRIVVSGNWADQDIILAIQELFSVGTLSELSISGNFYSLSQFRMLLAHCSTNITDVALCSIRITPAIHPLVGLHPSDRRIVLNSLDLWWSGGIHDWLNSDDCPFDFSNLKRLRLNENTSLLHWPVFASCIPRIEHLQFQSHPISDSALIDLAPFTNLKSIEIYMEYKDDISPALATLSTMAPANQIHTIRLRLPHASIPNAALGAEIDTQLVALPMPLLNAVELVYSSPLHGLPAVAENLPLLNARKLVRVYG
ncbi:hypothetical protein C8R44DRAFT_774671 [Mycena epipterygia]|nr:hypothetical protein C8R44DRAFT_774671 [Mycena epipterygia]